MNTSATSSSSLPLRPVALACHCALIVTLVLTTVGDQPTAARTAVATLVVAPLLLTLPGLLRDRRGAQRWLTVLLVLYIGATSVEVVARAGTPLVSAALLSAVAELAVLLTLIRRSRNHPPSAPG